MWSSTSRVDGFTISFIHGNVLLDGAAVAVVVFAWDRRRCHMSSLKNKPSPREDDHTRFYQGYTTTRICRIIIGLALLWGIIGLVTNGVSLLQTNQLC